MDANRGRCRKASREMHSVLATHTSSLTIAKSVTELDGVGAWASLHANYSRGTLALTFTLQRECMNPKPAKDLGQVRSAIMQWEEKWKGMMSELGGDAKIPDLWRMSALLDICPQDVKEQMSIRSDEIDENYENLKAKVVSYTTNKAARGGQRETTVPMELDYVSGDEMCDEHWDIMDEVRGDTRCYNCGTERQGQRQRRRRRQGLCQR